MFEDTTVFLVWLGMTYAFSVLITGFIDAYRRANQQISAEVKKKLNDLVHLVKPEEHGDLEYWFDQDSNEFLAQGATFDEIREILKTRYPGHLFFFKDSEQRVIMLTDKNDWKPVHVDQDIHFKL